jgi:WD40 repeat protein
MFKMIEGLPLLKRVPFSVWIALIVVGTAAIILHWEGSEEPVATADKKPSIVQPLEGDEPTPDERDSVDPPGFSDPLPPGAIARLGTSRFYHEGGIHCCFFLPDGLTLATGGGDGTVRFWEASTGKEQRIFRGNPAGITCMALTPDGATLATISWDNTARLWDVASGKPLRALTRPVQGTVRCIFAPDGKTLVTSDRSGALRRWEADTGEELLPSFMGQAGPITSLACTSDGRLLVASCQDHTVRLWDVATAQQRRVIQLPDDVLLVTISPDGKEMAQNTAATTRVVEIASGQLLQELRQGTTRNLAFSPDGQTLAATTRTYGIRLWDIATGKKLLVTPGGRAPAPVTFCFSADSTLLASAIPNAIRIWDVQTGKERVKVPRLQAMTTLHFSADGQSLTTASSIDGTIRFWQVATGKQLHFVRGSGRVIGLSPDGKVAASVPDPRLGPSSDPLTTVYLCDTATGKQRQLLQSGAAVAGVAFAPDGKKVAVSEVGGMISLWETETGREIGRFGENAPETLASHGFWTSALAFSPDGRTLACGCRDSTVRLWDVDTGQQGRPFGKSRDLDEELVRRVIRNRTPLPGVAKLAFSADGKTLAASVPNMQNCPIHLWDVASGKELRQLTVQEKHPDWVDVMAFSPDGKTLASAHTGDNTILLWDVATGKERQRLHGHRGGVLSLAFSPDGKVLASGSMDGTALIWDLRVANFLFKLPS